MIDRQGIADHHSLLQAIRYSKLGPGSAEALEKGILGRLLPSRRPLGPLLSVKASYISSDAYYPLTLGNFLDHFMPHFCL